MLLAHAAHALYWVVPVAVLFGGLVALTWVDKRRSRHEAAPASTDGDRASAEQRVRAYRESSKRGA